MRSRWIVLSSLFLVGAWSCGDDSSATGDDLESPDASMASDAIDSGTDTQTDQQTTQPDAGPSALPDASTMDAIDVVDSGVSDEDPGPVLTSAEAQAICESMAQLVTSSSLTEGFCSLSASQAASQTTDAAGDAGILTPQSECQTCVDDGGSATAASAFAACAETIADCDLTLAATDACADEAVPKIASALPSCDAAGAVDRLVYLRLLTVLDGEACTAVVADCPAVGSFVVNAVAP